MPRSTSSSTTPTAYAVSPDSGEHWTAEGAWEVAPGIHRIPLPLPMDGLKAINVYVITTDDGLVLIDGGWSIEIARDLLDRVPARPRRRVRRHPPVPGHPHPPRPLHAGAGAGQGARRRRRARPRRGARAGRAQQPRGAHREPVRRRCSGPPARTTSPSSGTQPAREDGRADLPGPGLVGVPRQLARPATTRSRSGARTLDAVETPGPHAGPLRLRRPGGRPAVRRRPRAADDHAVDRLHVPGRAAAARRLHGLADQGARRCPTCAILPAHGPVAPSSHARVDELLAFHDKRLALCLDALAGGTRVLRGRRRPRWAGPGTSTPYDELDEFSRGMAAMETKAHLDLLVARGEATRRSTRTAWSPSREFTGPGNCVHRAGRRIGRCGIPSSRNSGPVTSKPKRGVPAGERRLRVQHDVPVRADLERGLHQPVRPALPADRRVQGDPADPPGVAVVEHPRAAEHHAARPRCTTCRVSGSRSRPSRSG